MEGAAYFSAAGNSGVDGYEDLYRPIGFSDARKLVAAGKENLDLAALVAAFGGHEPKSLQLFSDSAGRTSLSQKIVVYETGGFAFIYFQWDEPFFLGKVKTNFDLLVFDENGHFISPYDSNALAYYSAGDNLQIDEPAEFVYLFPQGQFFTRYQLVIANWNDGPAQHVKFVKPNSGFYGPVETEHQSAATIWGHAAARHGLAVAAMYYGITDFPEDYSSKGPVTIYLDRKGNRLPHPEIRAVPQITGIDGVNMAYPNYPGLDIDGDGNPNFLGASAAAPNVAAVAALVLQSEGGPGSMNPDALYERLERTAAPVPLAIDRTIAGTIAGPVVIVAQGDFTWFDHYYSIGILPVTSRTVRSIVLDATGPGLNFFPNFPPYPLSTTFPVGTARGLDPTDMTPRVSADLRKLNLNFAPGKFGANDMITFGAQAYDPVEGFVDIDADRFEGMKATVTFDDGKTATGTFVVAPKMRINTFTGAGLVNADAATRHR